MYFCITGHTPITSVERVMDDPLPRLTTVAKDRYSENFLHAIDTALAIHPQNRPQSIAEFRALLNDGHFSGDTVTASNTSRSPAEKNRKNSPLPVAHTASKAGNWLKLTAIIATIAAIVVLGIIAGNLIVHQPDETSQSANNLPEDISTPNQSVTIDTAIIELPSDETSASLPVPRQKPDIPFSIAEQFRQKLVQPKKASVELAPTQVVPADDKRTQTPVTLATEEKPAAAASSETKKLSPYCRELLIKGSQQPLSLEEAYTLHEQC